VDERSDAGDAHQVEAFLIQEGGQWFLLHCPIPKLHFVTFAFQDSAKIAQP
jgi:hypothetical protein